VDEVVVVVLFRARPDRVEAAEAAFGEAVPPTHAEEGCTAFAVHRVPGDPERFVLVERWASREALDRHLTTPHLAAFRERGADIWAEPPQLTVAAAMPLGDPAKGTLAGA
jgi:quinol monooxygenase YgiN